MNAVELTLPDGGPARVWMCGKCRRLHSRDGQAVGDGNGRWYTPEERDEFGREKAVKCCDYRCESCGEKCREFYSRCDKHQAEKFAADERVTEAARFEKAVKIDPAAVAFDCMVYDALADRWHRDLEAAEEWYAEDEERVRPAYLWLSDPVDWSPDPSGTFGDQMRDHFHEDAAAEITSGEWDELDKWVAAWWERVKPTSYTPDFSRCVMLPAEEPTATHTGGQP